MVEDVERYRWVEEVDALGITAVRCGGEALQLLTGAGWEARLEGRDTFGLESHDWDADLEHVLAFRRGEWLYLVAPNGWEFSLPETLLSLAGPLEAVSVFWNVNAVMGVVVTRDGAVVRQFDPMFYDSVEPPLPEEAGLPFGEEDVVLEEAMMVLLERLTGEPLEGGEVLSEEHDLLVVRRRNDLH